MRSPWAKGFYIDLIYVSWHPPALSPQRVKERVAIGRHDVDPDCTVRRYRRSHEQLRWFDERADFLMVFDNSDSWVGILPALLATKLPDRPMRHLRPGVNPAVDAAFVGKPPSHA